MVIPLPENVLDCLRALGAAGYGAYLVGGCVRDALLGREPGDWDLCTSATPDEVKTVFAGRRLLDTGLQHGTVTLLAGAMPLEITTFRVDGSYEDHRRPSSVLFTRTLEEDLRRRDFTVNAIAYHPDEGLRDPFGGQEDLRHGVLRCVGEPAARFEEDALRILRLLRFCATLGFEPAVETLAAAGTQRSLLAYVAAERIQVELSKLLLGENVQRALQLAARSGILAQLLPEASLCEAADGGDDGTRFAPLPLAPADLPVRLALLLAVCGIDPAPGERLFDAAPPALQRLRLPTRMLAEVTRLLQLRHEPTPPDAPALRRRIGQHGAAFARQLIELRRALAAGHTPPDEEVLTALAAETALLEGLLRGPRLFSIGDLAVNGADLVALGAAPGPALGDLLDALLDWALADPTRNERAALQQQALQLLQGNSPQQPGRRQ